MAVAKKADDRVAVGERVIALRTEGKSFAAIAKAVGVDRSLDAFKQFADAIARRPEGERDQLRADEGRRLDSLEKRTRRVAEGEELDRKLASIAKLRKRLAAE